MSEGNGRQYVTNKELKEEIDKLPTRWEVRTLILLAVVGGRLLPIQFPGQTQAVAHAVMGVLM